MPLLIAIAQTVSTNLFCETAKITVAHFFALVQYLVIGRQELPT